MNYNTLKRVILAKQAGAFTSMIWERPLPVRAAFKNDLVIVKRSTGVVRCGVEYDHMASVQQKRSIGELPAVNSGLKWGEWLLAPYFIQHKGNTYLRCASSHANKIKVQYFMNGRPVERSAIEPFCTKAAFTDHDSLDVFTVNVENILGIR